MCILKSSLSSSSRRLFKRNNKLSAVILHIGIYIFVSISIVINVVKCDYGHNGHDIKALTGEPNYKSVHLSWEIEEQPSSNQSSDDIIGIPTTFTIFYCELQSFGPHRCRSKIIDDNAISDYDETIKRYSTVIDNLRMATKYSFHIKPQIKKKSIKISGRSDNRDNEIEPDSMFNGQTIIIPTKGFSAEATKCLPQASEIEVETGPYFGGKIVVDGGKCGIQGDAKSSIDKYVMRIDHNRCGSIVKPDTNTVETFITVQENVGIFTHSTRRFVVVCTFQSGIQTVRASFTVPGKSSVIANMNNNNNNSSSQLSERNGRERQFRIVDKSALVLKENHNDDIKNKNHPNDTIPKLNSSQTENYHKIAQLNEANNFEENKHFLKSENLMREQVLDNLNRHVKYARLVDEYDARIDEHSNSRESRFTSYTGIVMAVSLSVIMIGVFIYIMQRELRRQKDNNLPKRIMIRNPSI